MGRKGLNAEGEPGGCAGSPSPPPEPGQPRHPASGPPGRRSGETCAETLSSLPRATGRGTQLATTAGPVCPRRPGSRSAPGGQVLVWPPLPTGLPLPQGRSPAGPAGSGRQLPWPAVLCGPGAHLRTRDCRAAPGLTGGPGEKPAAWVGKAADPGGQEGEACREVSARQAAGVRKGHAKLSLSPAHLVPPSPQHRRAVL